MAGNFTDIAVNAAARASTFNAPLQELSDAVDQRMSKGELVLNVKDYGAVGDGVQDDSQAIVNAATALSNAGGGTLFFAKGRYRVFSTDYLAELNETAYENVLIDLNGLSGVRIEGSGAKVYADRAFEEQEYTSFLTVTDCTDVDVRGIEFETKDATTWGAGERERGMLVMNALGGCRDLSLRAKVTGGRAFRAHSESDDTDADRTIGVTVDLTCDHVAYGVGCNFSGDSLTGRIISDSSHRTYFVYGVKNHRVQIVSKNQDASDCIVGAFEGQGCENMDIDYTNVDSDAASSAAECVRVQYGDTTAAEIKDVRFRVDIRWNASGAPGHGFQIVKFNDGVFDTTDRGHVLKGLTLSGRFRGGSAGSANPTKFSGTWGSGETFSGFVWKDIVLDGTATAEFTFDSLTDHALVQNVVGDCHVSVRGNSTGRITVVGCDALSLCASSSDTTSQIRYIGCTIESDVRQAFTAGKITFVDTTIGTRVYNRLSNDEPSSTVPTLALNEVGVFGGQEVLTDLSTTDVELNGGRGFGNGVTHVRIRTVDGFRGVFTIQTALKLGTAWDSVAVGGANCAITQSGDEYAVVVDGDAKTYTFTMDSGNAHLKLRCSSTATGNTEVGYLVFNP